jgi:hypothetical protein
MVQHSLEAAGQAQQALLKHHAAAWLSGLNRLSGMVSIIAAILVRQNYWQITLESNLTFVFESESSKSSHQSRQTRKSRKRRRPLGHHSLVESYEQRIRDYKTEIEGLQTSLDEAKRNIAQAEQCAIFRTMLFTSNRVHWKDALDLGRDLRDKGLLNLGDHHISMNALWGLTTHKLVNWKSPQDERDIVTQLFHLIMENGGRRSLNLVCPSGRSPLLRAICNGSMIAAELIALEPETDVDFHSATDGHKCALFMALDRREITLFETLLKRAPHIDLDIICESAVAGVAGANLATYIESVLRLAPQFSNDLKRAQNALRCAQAAVDEYKTVAPLAVTITLCRTARFPRPLSDIVCSLLRLSPIHPALAHLAS